MVRRRRRRPWQVDWKDPNIILQQQQQHEEENNNLIIVNAATAHISRTEIPDHILKRIQQDYPQLKGKKGSKIQGQDHTTQDDQDDPDKHEYNNNDEGHWLLSIRLLAVQQHQQQQQRYYSEGKSFTAQTPSADLPSVGNHNHNETVSHPSVSSISSQPQSPNHLVASQVKIEILYVDGKSEISDDGRDDDEDLGSIVQTADETFTTNETRTPNTSSGTILSVFQKTLQWPETIENAVKRHQNSDRNKKKNKNWFVDKVWKPLLGEIDEEVMDDSKKNDDNDNNNNNFSPNDTQTRAEPSGEKEENDGMAGDRAATDHPPPDQVSGPGLSVRSGDSSTFGDENEHAWDKDEHNDYDDDDDDIAEGLLLNQSSSLARGIVSATFCRRPSGPVEQNIDIDHNHDNDSTDIQNSSSNTTSSPDKETGFATKAEISHAADTISMMNLGISSPPPTNLPKSDSRHTDDNGRMTHQREESDTTHLQKADSVESTNQMEATRLDIHFVCINHIGKVFVYNPWELLLPQSASADEKQNNNGSDGDDFAQLLFGQSLFNTLEQTWKPLSEPISTIHPGVFSSAPTPGQSPLPSKVDDSEQHGRNKANLRAVVNDNSTHTGPPSLIHQRNVQENEVSGTDNSITVDGQIPDHDEITTTSAETPQSDGTRTTTSSHRHGRNRKHRNKRRHRRPKNNNPFFLWNPTFDSATLKDATTIANQPISVHAAGPSYVVILGKGIRELKRTSRHSEENSNDTIAELNSDEDRPWWSKSSSSADGSVRDAGTRKGNFDDKEEIIDANEQPVNRRNEDRHVQKTVSTHSTTHSQRRRRHQKQRYRHGGFITFVSTAHWSETKTIFLPFSPISVSYIRNWMGAEWSLVAGTTRAILIRMNASETIDNGKISNPISIPVGSPISTSATGRKRTFSNNLDPTQYDQLVEDESVETHVVKKYQIVPINSHLSGMIAPRLVCGPESLVDPPSILEVYVENDANKQHALVLLKTFDRCTPEGTISLAHRPSDIAKISIHQQAEDASNLVPHDSLSNAWCQHGQGWSLLGNRSHVFFICWEGSTLAEGAYVKEFSIGLPGTLAVSTAPILKTVHTAAPLESTGAFSSTGQMPFSTSLKDVIGHASARESQIVNISSDLIFKAMDTLTRAYSTTKIVNDQFHVKRKSELLLEHCESWTQLHDTSESIAVLERQFPLLSIQSGFSSSPQSMFCLRNVVDENGPASPFQQVLSWLAQRGDYFDAASLALDLLNDSDCLYDLWTSAGIIDENDGRNRLEGLLDGIIPVELATTVDISNLEGIDSASQLSISHLSDMTIACMIKGGFGMSRTLSRFLTSNKSYDPARACLMLAATTAVALSGDTSGRMGTVAKTSPSLTYDAVLWPAKCLVDVGTSRDYLETALKLLNVTVPDELRNRWDQDESTQQKPDPKLTEKLVELILACDPMAQHILFDFEDTTSGNRYWSSINHDTRLRLALIEIDSLYPLLRNAEVRKWVRNLLDSNIRNTSTNESNLPSEWLQRLCMACLTNAGCDVSSLQVTSDVSNEVSIPTGNLDNDDDDDDGLHRMKLEIEESRDALVGKSIDFDLLISTLLLLDMRKVSWSSKADVVSTQTVLNATCYMAGRGADEIGLFDGPTCMKYCFLANNVEAGANLIGRKNGLILHCCDVMVKELGISMSEAESHIMCDEFDLSFVDGLEWSSFEFTESHQKLLWLLDEHVLRVRTFGEFDTVHSRGRVDPVFASKLVFRTWLAITYGDLDTASESLDRWLSRRLSINRESFQGSTHRLACAALANALVFSNIITEDDKQDVVDPREKKTTTLAEAMKIRKKLVIDICQSSCGIVHSAEFNN